jgi:hypothetical protein
MTMPPAVPKIDVVDLGLPWAHRPLEYDDWGMIRDTHSSPVCDACCGAQYTDLEADEARRTKTVPPKVQAIADHIILACNAHADLVAALKPFAEAAEMYSWPVHEGDKHQFSSGTTLTVGDLRKARDLLTALAKARAT